MRSSAASEVLKTTDVGSPDGFAGEMVPNPVRVTTPVDGIASWEPDLAVTIAIGIPMTAKIRTMTIAKRMGGRPRIRF